MVIGIFDSGIGGLRTLQEYRKINQNGDVYFFSDNLRFPYANHSKQKQIDYTSEVCDKLIGYGCSCLAIACNTITSVAYETIISRYDVPIIDVINPTISHITEKKYLNYVF